MVRVGMEAVSTSAMLPAAKDAVTAAVIFGGVRAIRAAEMPLGGVLDHDGGDGRLLTLAGLEAGEAALGEVATGNT